MRGSRCPSACSLARDWPSGLRLLVSSSSGTVPGISRKCPRTWLRPLDIRTSLLCSKFRVRERTQRLRALLQYKTFEHYFTTSPLWKNQTNLLGKTWPNMAKHIFFPKLTGLKQGKAPTRIVQNSNVTHAAALRLRALGRFAAGWALIAFPR